MLIQIDPFVFQFYFYILPILTGALTCILILVLYCKSKIPFPLFACFSKKFPVMIHNAGRVSVRFARVFEGIAQLGPHEFALLPEIPKVSAGNPHPKTHAKLSDFLSQRGILDRLNRPILFMDASIPALATPQIWASLSKGFRIPLPDKKEQKDPEALEKIGITLRQGLICSWDDLRDLISKSYQPSKLTALNITSEKIGREEAGFSLRRFSVGFGVILAIGLIFIIVASQVGLLK